MGGGPWVRWTLGDGSLTRDAEPWTRGHGQAAMVRGAGPWSVDHGQWAMGGRAMHLKLKNLHCWWIIVTNSWSYTVCRYSTTGVCYLFARIISCHHQYVKAVHSLRYNVSTLHRNQHYLRSFTYDHASFLTGHSFSLGMRSTYLQ